MLLHFTQSGRDIHIALTDMFNRELFAKFIVKVRDSQIVGYEFNNLKLLPYTFHYVSRYVSGLYLIYLKNHVGKCLDVPLDDFSLN